MKSKKNLWVLLGCGMLVAGMSVGLMGCPEDDDDDFFKSAGIHSEAPMKADHIQG